MKYSIKKIKNIFRAHKLKKYKNLKAFTLIELLIVIGIIGILAGTSFSPIQSALRKAQDTKRLVQFEDVVKALELYYIDNGHYPIVSGLNTLGWNAEFLNYPSTLPSTYSIVIICSNLDFVRRWDIEWLNVLVNNGYLQKIPNEPRAGCTNGRSGYQYMTSRDGKKYILVNENTFWNAIQHDHCFHGDRKYTLVSSSFKPNNQFGTGC